MSAEVAPAVSDPYHSLILQGLTMRDSGYAARRARVFALRDRGWRPGAIADELEREAREAGCTEWEIRHCLGISIHNVRIILREWRGQVAEQDEESVQ